jgi:hypothetical protein
MFIVSLLTLSLHLFGKRRLILFMLNVRVRVRVTTGCV